MFFLTGSETPKPKSPPKPAKQNHPSDRGTHRLQLFVRKVGLVYGLSVSRLLSGSGGFCLGVIPRHSMYGVFTYIYPSNYINVGKYTIHRVSGSVIGWLETAWKFSFMGQFIETTKKKMIEIPKFDDHDKF